MPLRISAELLGRLLRPSQQLYEVEVLSSAMASSSTSEASQGLTSCEGWVQVGAATEAELEDRKLRVEDAKNATFAAVSALLHAPCADTLNLLCLSVNL